MEELEDNEIYKILETISKENPFHIIIKNKFRFHKSVNRFSGFDFRTELFFVLDINGMTKKLIEIPNAKEDIEEFLISRL
ncbi:MAG: hypothetical protein H7836_17735 [Magnetococcus sp. YQC-3]